MRVLVARVRAVTAAVVLGALLVALLPAVSVAHDPPGIARFKAAVGWVESGGRYDAVNPVSGAYGKYQILPSNWPSWAARYVGDRNAPPTPRNQERVAHGKFSDLHTWLGNWHQVAYWWLTGRDGRSGNWSSTARRYVERVMTFYRDGVPGGSGGSTASATRIVLAETAKAVAYTGRWQAAGHGGYAGGQVRYATSRGATATVTFTGTSIAWYGPKGPTRGRARVLVDGKPVATVDLRAGGFQARRLLFSRRFPGGGRHTLTIEVLGTSGRPYVAIDGFVVGRDG